MVQLYTVSTVRTTISEMLGNQYERYCNCAIGDGFWFLLHYCVVSLFKEFLALVYSLDTWFVLSILLSPVTVQARYFLKNQ